MVSMTLLAVVAMAGFVERPPPGAAINTSVFLEMLFLSLALADRVRQLRDERALAVKASDEKSSFLAILSHEVRTPLNGILGTVELLRRTVLSSKQKDYVETLSHAGRALMTLLNDVLDLAKAEAGKLELTPAPVNPRRLLESMAQLMLARAREKGIAIECHVGDTVPETVLADEVRLRQILLNLISNAVKFTEKGRIDVALTQEGEHDGRHRLIWEVRDTGAGIPPDAMAHLFDRFVQVDSSMTRRHEGTGLGLAICKDLVEIMGGTIDAESSEGKGSRFSFTLDLEATDMPVVAEGVGDEHRLPTGWHEPSTILIVDDVEMNRDVLGELMSNEGFTVELASNGATALQRLEKDGIDAVVLDVFMPDLDGMTVARALRDRGDTLPIIGLTAAMDPELRTACRESGMDIVLTKPASLEELSVNIRQLTGKGMDVSLLPILDDTILDGFRQSLGEAKMISIVGQFRTRSRDQIEAIGKTTEPLDWPALTAEAHRLAGMASMLGLIRLSALAEEISVKARQECENTDFAEAVRSLMALRTDSLESLAQVLTPTPELSAS
jgi:signal transduction histidine kinase/DNA-binding NarL/FixJ family response regulator